MARIGSARFNSQSISLHQSITNGWSYLVWILRSALRKFVTKKGVLGQGWLMSLYVRLSLPSVLGAAHQLYRPPSTNKIRSHLTYTANFNDHTVRLHHAVLRDLRDVNLFVSRPPDGTIGRLRTNHHGQDTLQQDKNNRSKPQLL